MAYVYSVKTSQGNYDVTVQNHHDHVSRADFERALLTALASVGSGIVLHHYAFKGRR
jgi:hypothetical protein